MTSRESHNLIRLIVLAFILATAAAMLPGCRSIATTTSLSNSKEAGALAQAKTLIDKGDYRAAKAKIGEAEKADAEQQAGYQKWIDDLNTKLWQAKTDYAVIMGKTSVYVVLRWEKWIGWALTFGVLIGAGVVVAIIVIRVKFGWLWKLITLGLG